MAVQEIDQDLLDGLKQAKSKRMRFAVVLKGGTDGALLVDKQKVSAPDIAEAKKRTGGSAVITGACFGEDGKIIFEVIKPPPGTLAATLKTITKKSCGLSIIAEVRLSTDAELLGEAAAAGGGPATADVKADPTAKGPSGPLAQTGTYEAALNTWEQAAAASLASIDQLVSSLEGTGDEVALAISGIIQQAQADFPDTVDDALSGLVAAAKAGKAPDAEQFRTKSEIAVRAALAYLNNNAKTFDGCENNPFGVAVQIRAPLTEALKQVLLAVK